MVGLAARGGFENLVGGRKYVCRFLAQPGQQYWHLGICFTELVGGIRVIPCFGAGSKARGFFVWGWKDAP